MTLARIKAFFLSIALLTIAFQINAQKVVVIETEEKADEMKRKGLSIMLELDEEVVRKEWQKKMRELGGMKTVSYTHLTLPTNREV